MKGYIFVLGRDFQLSILEIISYLQARKMQYKIKSFNKKAALISLPDDTDINKMMLYLGGTVKIARVLNSINELVMPNKNKIYYSILEIDSKNGEKINAELRKTFKKEKMKGYLKRSEDIGLSPSKFVKKNIFEEGFEIILYGEIMAETIAVFDPREHEFRDNRPYLDKKKLTSIRLSKILINLSQAKEHDTLLDPFCGSATILQEALLMGINVIGMDTDSMSIYQANKNLNWLKNKYNFKSSFLLVNKAAQSSSGYIEKVDAVATEPYLGPYLKRLPSLNNAEKTAVELARLYFDFLNDLKIILKKGKVAIVIPKFRTKEQAPVKIDLQEIAGGAGFKIYNPFPGIKIPVLYAPKGTKLDREIYILEKA